MLDSDSKDTLMGSFYKDLEFGTGGLRGIMGAGTNRMNIYTRWNGYTRICHYLKMNFKDKGANLGSSMPRLRNEAAHENEGYTNPWTAIR